MRGLKGLMVWAEIVGLDGARIPKDLDDVMEGSGPLNRWLELLWFGVLGQNVIIVVDCDQ